MIRPHQDALVNQNATLPNGDPQDIQSYALKIGETVPEDGVNLAFFSKPQLTTENISFFSKWNSLLTRGGLINQQESDTIYRDLVVDSNGLLTSLSGQTDWPTNNLYITSEYSIDGTPMFFVQMVDKPILVNNIGELVQYLRFYDGKVAQRVSKVEENIPYTYIGNKVKIRSLRDGTELSKDHYKVKVTLENISAVPTYTVVIYVDRMYIEDQLAIYYTSYNSDTHKEEPTIEPLSPFQVFYRSGFIDDINDPDGYGFYTEEVNGKYKVYVPCDKSIVTPEQRDPHWFRYRIVANLDVPISSRNNTIRAGMMFYDGTDRNINIAKDALCAMVNSTGAYSIPDTLTLVNPHAAYGTDKTSSSYWKIDPFMDLKFWMDYDIIIIAGCGRVDLSYHAPKIHKFLENGGKLFIENITNDETNRFIPVFNTTANNTAQYSILDVAVNPTGNAIASTLSVNADSNFNSTHYGITNSDCGSMRYIDNGTAVGVRFLFGGSDSASNWTSIIKDANNNPIVMVKQYQGSGEIVYSNMGLLRSIRNSSGNDGALKLFSNILMYSIRHKVVTMPWTSSHLYHINTLYDSEYNVEGKSAYLVGTYAGKQVAKRILATSTRDALYPYIDRAYRSGTGTYRTICQQFTGTEWRNSTIINMTPENDGSEPLWACSDIINSGIYNAYNKTSKATVVPSSVSFQVTVTPYTYKYSSGVYTKILGTPAIRTASIKSLGKLQRVFYLSSSLPGLPSGSEWADVNNVFYEVSTNAYSNGVFSLDTDHNVSVYIYNTKSGKCFYSNDGSCAISYADLFTNIDNIAVLAISDIYDVYFQSRKYAMKYATSNSMVYASLPRILDQNEKWPIYIHNGRFTGDLGFYDTINHPSPSIFANFGSYTPIYDVTDKYDKQAFSYAFGMKSVIDEKAEFVSPNMIQVVNTPLYVDEESWAEEQLTPTSTENVYVSKHKFWTNCENIAAIIQDPETNERSVEIMDESEYKVDLTKGLLTVLTPRVNAVGYIAYITFSNVIVKKQAISNQSVIAEPINEAIDITHFKLKNSNIVVEGPMAPVVYTYSNKTKSVLNKNRYTIDAVNGIINITEVPDGRLYIDYTYYIEEQLSVKKANHMSGIIVLNDTISFFDHIYVSYTYLTEDIPYTGYLDEDGIFRELDLNPTEGHYSYQSVINNDKNAIENVVAPTNKLIGKEIYLYLLPKEVWQNTNTSSRVLTQRNSECVRHCVGASEYTAVLKKHPFAILLATITINNPYTMDDLIVLDTRTRGGGLRDDVDQSEIGLGQYIWDDSMFDGLLYQSNAVAVIKIPKAVLKQNGGIFTQDEVSTIVNKHIALGVLPIIEYV